MPSIEPLPFRLSIPGKDTIDSQGIRSISYQSEGLLHLIDGTLTLEWAATRSTERVGFTGIRTEVDHSPIGTCDVPVSWIGEARLRLGWRGWRLTLRARRLDAFEGVPGRQPGSLTLRIRRRDRKHAAAFVAEINAAAVALPLTEGPTQQQIGEGDL
jgi:hypothetical protein